MATTHWRRWASFSELTEILAEAAPKCFLNKLEQSIAAEDGVVVLFDQESDFFNGGGGAPHTSLLRALEVLAWAPHHTARTAELLARLAERDPAGRLQNGGQFLGGRLVNRPDASLEAIFHLVVPRTLCEDKQLQEILGVLVRRHRALGFELIVQFSDHLQTPGEVSSACPQRRWLVPDEPTIPSDTQLEERVERAYCLLLEVAEVDVKRWSRLIGLRIDKRWGEAYLDRMFDTLIQRRPEIVDPQTTIWSTLRSELHLIYELDAYKSGLADKEQRWIDQLRALYRDFEPADLILRVAWQFTARHVWPDPQPRGYPEIEGALLELRVRSLDELLSREDGESRLVQLIGHLDSIDPGSRLHPLGFALARSTQAAHFEEALLLHRGPSPLDRLAMPLALGAFHREGHKIEWLRQLLESWREQERRQEALELMLVFCPDPEKWSLLAEIDEHLEARYWAELFPLRGDLTAVHISHALDKLLANGNVDAALVAASSHRRALSIDELVRTLEHVVERRKDPTKIKSLTHVSYDVTSIFSELDQRLPSELSDELALRLFRLEAPFIGWFEHNGRGARYLGRALAGDPHLFVELVRLARLADDYKADTDKPFGPEEKQAARNARFLLKSWTTYPGRDLDDPVASEQRLHEWVQEVLRLAKDCKRLKGAIDELGKVLARPPKADDGHWPCRAARELLESGDYLEFAHALQVAKQNLGGVFVFGDDDGGTQERELARAFARSADALRATYSATAQALDELAASYTRDGDYWQRFSHENRLDSGRSRERHNSKSDSEDDECADDDPPT